ncbi:coat protein [Scadoxus chlorotic ringspot virus]|nr:coat protein [Scadoxus chlorotic ringspot virus]
MTTAKKLNKDTILLLLSGTPADVEIENSSSDNSFVFKDFIVKHQELELSFNNGCTILRNRSTIYKHVKTGGYSFCGHNIKIGASDSEDWTFRRMEGFIRAKMFLMYKGEKSDKIKSEMYKKLCDLPLVSAYGLKVPTEPSDLHARIILCLGAPLSLMASLDKFASVAFPLAYFQNVKKESLGIKSFSTYEQLCKVARVLDSRSYKFIDDDNVFDNVVNALAECIPGTAGTASLNKFKTQLDILAQKLGKMVDDTNAGPSSTKKSSEKVSF